VSEQITVNRRRLNVVHSTFQAALLLQLFRGLQSQAETFDTRFITEIITETVNLVDRSLGSSSQWPVEGGRGHLHAPLLAHSELFTEISRFSSTFLRRQGNLDVLISAVKLARVEVLGDLKHLQILSSRKRAGDVGWIYLALQHIQPPWKENETSVEVPDEQDISFTLVADSLLQALACSGDGAHSVQKPPLESFRPILWALSTSGDIAFTAFLVLHWARDVWFLDPDFYQNVAGSSLWPRLGCIALRYPELASYYIEMGRILSGSSPEWKTAMYKDLITWITALFEAQFVLTPESSRSFNSVMHRVWMPHSNKQTCSDDPEESWALALSALSKFWENVDYADFHELTRMTRCTITTCLLEGYSYQDTEYTPAIPKGISPMCRAKFSSLLSKSLVRASTRIRNALAAEPPTSTGISGSHEKTNSLRGLAQLLDVLGQKIETELPGSGEVELGSSTTTYRDRVGLQLIFHNELFAIEESAEVGEDV
jgi:hypothetical protein